MCSCLHTYNLHIIDPAGYDPKHLTNLVIKFSYDLVNSSDLRVFFESAFSSRQFSLQKCDVGSTELTDSGKGILDHPLSVQDED